MIQFENVGMRYGTGPEVLRDLSFMAAAGSFHFVTGPSGAGKTSLLRLLYLAHRPSRGLITLFGRDLATLHRRDLPGLRRRIGVVFQEHRLIGHLSARDNVALPLKIAGLGRGEIDGRVDELLRWVGLHDQRDARPTSLSGGEQQRIAIARAVVAGPDLVIADEPTGNLDDALGLRLMRLFDELNRQGTTVVIATHNAQMVSRFDHPVLALEDGQIRRHGKAAEVSG